MEHNRHRAPERHPRRPLIIASMFGIAIGAMLVATGWWLSETAVFPSHAASPTPTTTSGATADSSDRGRPSESRNEITIPTAAPVSPTSADDPVLLIGDSLAVGIEYYVDVGLGDRAMTTDAAEGRGTATQVSLLETYADTSAPVWVVSLGTNDNVEEFPQQAKAIMELAGPDRCVVWFDVWREETDESINATLDALAAEHSNLHLVPWHDTSSLHYDWFSGADVHPSSEGYAVRGQMAVDAITEYCS